MCLKNQTSQYGSYLIFDVQGVLVSGSACRGRLFYVIGNSVGIAYYIKSLTEQERTAAEG